MDYSPIYNDVNTGENEQQCHVNMSDDVDLLECNVNENVFQVQFQENNLYKHVPVIDLSNIILRLFIF